MLHNQLHVVFLELNIEGYETINCSLILRAVGMDPQTEPLPISHCKRGITQMLYWISASLSLEGLWHSVF